MRLKHKICATLTLPLIIPDCLIGDTLCEKIVSRFLWFYDFLIDVIDFSLMSLSGNTLWTVFSSCTFSAKRHGLRDKRRGELITRTVITINKQRSIISEHRCAGECGGPTSAGWLRTVWYSPVTRGEDETVVEVTVDIRELCLVIKSGMADIEISNKCMCNVRLTTIANLCNSVVQYQGYMLGVRFRVTNDATIPTPLK